MSRRRRPEPILHARRTCPACQRRYAGLVNPECPLCHGTGTLTIGPAALATIGPEPAARAIELHYERVATQAASTYPPAHPAHAQLLEQATQDLTHRGLLADPLITTSHVGEVTDAAPRHDRTHNPAARAAATQQALRYLGWNNPPASTAAATRLDTAPNLPTGRPHDRGQLPQVSANGSPANLARATNPWHPLEHTTTELTDHRRTTEHTATTAANTLRTTA